MLDAPFKSFCYKNVGGTPISFDLHSPTSVRDAGAVPAVVYFHGGGLTVGNRSTWIPDWLFNRVLAAGYAFISADYRLITPSTGHDIIADIKDLFTFIANDLNPLLESASDGPAKFRINPQALAVAGSSAGGLVTYLAAIHASPRPVAAVCVYAMGGNFLTHHYVAPKSAPFFLDEPLFDPRASAEYLYPFPHALAEIANSQPSEDADKLKPTNPRMPLAALYLQLGTWLDYYTGAHVPGLSAVLREALQDAPVANEALTAQIRSVIPARHQALFPQFNVTPEFPPTYLLHGTQDSAVAVDESRHFYDLLRHAGVHSSLDIVEGKDHSFDYADDAEEVYGSNFDQILAFLRQYLERKD